MPPRRPGATLRAMEALWIAVTFAYVLLGLVIVLGGGWRMFHPHDRYRHRAH